MGTEIERKFLVLSDDWRHGVTGQPMRQGYLSTDPHRTVRVRVSGGQAWLTIKGLGNDIERPEFEYAIPVADAHFMLDQLCQKPLLDKTRHRVPYRGRVFEVDVFHGENHGLVMAEVELDLVGSTVELPAWIGEEVTGDARYYNSSLVKNPYSAWPR